MFEGLLFPRTAKKLVLFWRATRADSEGLLLPGQRIQHSVSAPLFVAVKKPRFIEERREKEELFNHEGRSFSRYDG